MESDISQEQLIGEQNQTDNTFITEEHIQPIENVDMLDTNRQANKTAIADTTIETGDLASAPKEAKHDIYIKV